MSTNRLKITTGREGPFADRLNERYPIGSRACVCAAAGAIRRDLRLGKINRSEFKKYMFRVRRQAKDLGVTLSDENNHDNST